MGFDLQPGGLCQTEKFIFFGNVPVGLIGDGVISQWKGSTLAQRAVSHRHQRIRGKLVWSGGFLAARSPGLRLAGHHNHNECFSIARLVE
eukprot:447900-Pelagomonas_calceolata.AAC.1